ILGAGKIGSLISVLLDQSNDYQVYLGDIDVDNPNLKRNLAKKSHLEVVSLNAKDADELGKFITQNSIGSVISSLPYYCNSLVAEVAKEFKVNYFDLTEDTKTTSNIVNL